MKQAARFDGLSFDPFSLFQNGFAPPEVDVSGREVLQAFVVAAVIVVVDKGVNLLPEITGQMVVFSKDAVLQGLVPSLDFRLSSWVILAAFRRLLIGRKSVFLSAERPVAASQRTILQ